MNNLKRKRTDEPINYDKFLSEKKLWCLTKGELQRISDIVTGESDLRDGYMTIEVIRDGVMYCVIRLTFSDPVLKERSELSKHLSARKDLFYTIMELEDQTREFSTDFGHYEDGCDCKKRKKLEAVAYRKGAIYEYTEKPLDVFSTAQLKKITKNLKETTYREFEKDTYLAFLNAFNVKE